MLSPPANDTYQYNFNSTTTARSYELLEVINLSLEPLPLQPHRFLWMLNEKGLTMIKADNNIPSAACDRATLTRDEHPPTAQYSDDSFIGHLTGCLVDPWAFFCSSHARH